MHPLFSARSPQRIAVVRALYLGDLLCAIPALDALHRRFPRAEITLIGLPWARAVAERLPTVTRFVEFAGFPGLPEVPFDNERTAAFLEEARGERYDLAIQLHGSGVVSNGLVAAFGAGATLGFGPPHDRRLSTVLPWREGEHEIERWLRLVGALGADTRDTRIAWPIREGERARAAGLLCSIEQDHGPLVGLHCGSKLPSRRWPVARFAELADLLVCRHHARIVLTGGPDERQLAEAMQARMHAEPLDLVGQTDLGTFVALVERLDLLLTNDTGASHVAAATRTPSVVLFGPSRPLRWAPLDRARHAVIDAREVVGADVPEEAHLAHLPVEPVLAACERALRTVNRRRGPASVEFEAAMEYA